MAKTIMDMNFTIFTPVRGRPQLVHELLGKIKENTKYLDKIECLFWHDDDDQLMIDYVSKTDFREFGFSILFFQNPRPESLNYAINFLAKKAKGDFCFNVNDDCQIVTKDWDEIVLNKIAQYKQEREIKDNIIYCRTGDNSIDRNKEAGYASFPIISKQAVDVLGFFMYEDFKGLGGDSSIYLLWKAIDRIVDCQEVQLDHIYHSNLFRVMSPDRTASDMRANTQKSYINPYTFDVSKGVRKLKDYIENYK